MSIKNLIISFLLSFSNLPLLAQQALREFGDVQVHDFALSSADTANAIILFDKGTVVVDPGQVTGTSFTRHLRMLIINKEGLEHANFAFYAEKGGFRKPKGVTYNLENSKVSQTVLEESSIMQSRYNKYYDNIRIAFPNVKAGSIIELNYTLKYDDLYLPDWQFQETIPVLWSEYSIRVPFKDYVSHIRGSIKPTKYEEKYEGKSRSWTMVNLPAFKAEPLMPDKDVYLSLIEFEPYLKTWEDFRNRLNKRKDFAGLLLYHNSLKSRAAEVTAGITDSLGMIRSISNHLKANVHFNEEDDYLADEPDEVFARKTGSAGDINLLFGALLKKVGFKVNMVVLSTRDHGFVLQSFPSSSQFNYVVCLVTVGGKDLFLDATEKLLPYNLLPEKCFNHKGFLVSTQEYGWVGIEPIYRNKVFVDASLMLDEDGLLSGKLNTSKFDYAAYHARKTYAASGEEGLKKEMLGNASWMITKSEFLNIDQVEKPVTANYELTLDGQNTISSSKIYLNPHLFLREENNPFTAEQREFPIDFTGLTDNYSSVTITLPEGYEVEELPQSKIFTLPENAAKCSISFSQTGNKITVISRLLINKTLFQPEEYPNLKEFYTRLIAKKSESIVIRKK